MMNDTYIVKPSTSLKIKNTSWKVVRILYISLILLLMYLPVFFIIVSSFNSNTNNINEFESFTFKYYLNIFKKPSLRSAIINTLSISILSTLLSTVLGTLFAIGINSLSKKRRQRLILLNNLPILNADIVSGVFLFFVFKIIGGIFTDYPLGYVTLLLSHIFFSLPYVVLSVLPKLNEIDDNLFDAALDLGCKPNKALRKVIIPSIMGGIFSGAVLAFTMSIDDFTISYFVTRPGIQNLSIWIYSSSGNVRYGNIQSAYAFYSVLTVVMFAVLVIYNVLSSRKVARRKAGRS